MKTAFSVPRPGTEGHKSYDSVYAKYPVQAPPLGRSGGGGVLLSGRVFWGVMKYSVSRWCWRLHNFVIILETTELYIFKSLENKLKKKKIHQNGILVERHPLVLKVI